ncbi:hypothetical protein Zmor_024832 [Zophobas morio]|uniref:Ras-GEF domain-containing protein n=1 Tax=Zophobas morio TaxID=2755281 RepID=A0AA38HL39_9CUCU|nr:hypothetical protein Zmor_024832 [Zophobas morio]
MLDFARERDAKLTGRSEILALLGLLHLAGITKSVRLNIEQLWAKRNLQTYYVCCGTRFLMRYIRFDGKDRRGKQTNLERENVLLKKRLEDAEQKISKYEEATQKKSVDNYGPFAKLVFASPCQNCVCLRATLEDLQKSNEKAKDECIKLHENNTTLQRDCALLKEENAKLRKHMETFEDEIREQVALEFTHMQETELSSNGHAIKFALPEETLIETKEGNMHGTDVNVNKKITFTPPERCSNNNSKLDPSTTKVCETFKTDNICKENKDILSPSHEEGVGVSKVCSEGPFNMEKNRSSVEEAFTNCAWSKPTKDLHAKNIVNMISSLNEQANIVATEVLSNGTAGGRAKVIEYYIKVAKELLTLQNFNSLKGILSGLQGQPVYRLRKSWSAVSPKKKKLFKELSRLMDTELNYKEYRDVLKSSEPPCIPYLGVYLTDFTFIYHAFDHPSEL